MCVCIYAICTISTSIYALETTKPYGFDDPYIQQQHWAEQLEQQQQRFSLLEHNFFVNEHLRIYNHSAYQLQTLQYKWQQGQAMQLDWEDFALSLGYGMQFFLQKNSSIGYEYLSNFPYDRGQMIRVFYHYQY